MTEYRKRRSFEAGHSRKFLLVVDESPEVEVALYYAAARVVRSSGLILMLYVIEPQDFQHWAGVKQVQIEEETQKAKALFRLLRRKLNLVGFENIPCEELVREGVKGEEIISMPMTLSSALQELAYDYLSEKHSGWENNDGVYGNFVFNVARRAITLDYNERYTVSENYTYEF